MKFDHRYSHKKQCKAAGWTIVERPAAKFPRNIAPLWLVVAQGTSGIATAYAGMRIAACAGTQGNFDSQSGFHGHRRNGDVRQDVVPKDCLVFHACKI